MVRSKILAYLVIFIGLFSTSCQEQGRRHTPRGSGIDHRKPLAWGHEQTIYVFADERVWHYAQQPLQESLERYYWTTENERYFEIKRADIKDIAHYYRFKNLIFLAYLDSDKDVSQYVKARLTDNVLDSVRSQGVGMFYRNNLWANKQFVVFILGNNEENLLRYNILEANRLFELFKDKLYSYTETRVFAQDIYREAFFDNYIWEMNVPQNYVVYKEDENNRFVSFIARRRDNPDRYISIYYEKMDENKVSLEWAKSTRRNLVWDYYDEDEFSDQDVRMERVRFAGYDALLLAGRWQNRKYAVGGAFRSFVFYDERTATAWLIDNAVFYPEGDKLPALIETEVISRTLTIKP